ncbi:serine hydrolase, partial [Stenotrophomonas sp. 3diitr2024]|uniref:serine hydrolase n=1 Tax=Stenotrophomonas sp. 3diitr2024 TaxID=3345115 RepID=UPI0035CC654D
MPQVHQFFQAQQQAGQLQVLQVAVVKDGQIVLSEAYGLANVENGVLASRDTRFPLNSATKAFTGVA